jgi:hypothetical protein
MHHYWDLSVIQWLPKILDRARLMWAARFLVLVFTIPPKRDHLISAGRAGDGPSSLWYTPYTSHVLPRLSPSTVFQKGTGKHGAPYP